MILPWGIRKTVLHLVQRLKIYPRIGFARNVVRKRICLKRCKSFFSYSLGPPKFV